MGWVFNGDGGLDFLMVAVAVSGGLGVFIWKKRYKQRKRERGRDAKNKKELGGNHIFVPTFSADSHFGL